MAWRRAPGKAPLDLERLGSDGSQQGRYYSLELILVLGIKPRALLMLGDVALWPPPTLPLATRSAPEVYSLRGQPDRQPTPHVSKSLPW